MEERKLSFIRSPGIVACFLPAPQGVGGRRLSRSLRMLWNRRFFMGISSQLIR